MKPIARAALITSAALAFAACGGDNDSSTAPSTPSTPSKPSLVTGGTPDAGHPYVGTLVFQQVGEEGFFSCTGTLLSPTVMLTAGHCVSNEGEPNIVTNVRFTQNALEGRENYPSLQAWLDAEWIKAEEVVAHPQFDDFNQFPNIYDVGIVILSEPVNLDTYGALPEIGLLEQVLADHDRSNNLFTAVGYGLQGLIKPFFSDDFARYETTTRLIELKSTFTGTEQAAKFSNNPGPGSGTGGTCFGDSGGPILWDDTNIIGAITSWGITPCIGVDYNFRIDTELAQDFIRGFL
jgi:hypothetical protein